MPVQVPVDCSVAMAAAASLMSKSVVILYMQMTLASGSTLSPRCRYFSEYSIFILVGLEDRLLSELVYYYLVSGIGGDHPDFGDDGIDVLGRSGVEDRVPDLYPSRQFAWVHDLTGVPFLDLHQLSHYGLGGELVGLRADYERHPRLLGGQGYLGGADLVNECSVRADGIRPHEHDVYLLHAPAHRAVDDKAGGDLGGGEVTHRQQTLPPRARLGGIDANVLAISVGGLDDAQRGLAVAMGEDGHPAFQPLGADPSNYFNGLTGPFYETVGVGYH